MISIIICSTKQDIDTIIKENISNTIGVPYELIIINNSNNSYSIFSAYNEGIRRSQFPILCFIHEDIIFRSSNWGKLIYKSFETYKSLGMIGVIGATAIFEMSWGWWSAPKVGNIIQSDKKTRIKLTYNICNDETPILKDAVICDGLFLAFPKNIFKTISFDDNTYVGFHGYDMDISMQVLASGYKIAIIDNILIEHYSWGNIGEEYIDACYKFYNKWKNVLPISCVNEKTQEILQENYLKDIFRLCSKKKFLNSRLWHFNERLYHIYYFIKNNINKLMFQ